MKHASKFFTDFERSRIEQAVADTETKTDAEIVPVIATSSGRYDRAEDICGLWLAIASLAVVWTLFRLEDRGYAQWGSAWSRFELPILLLTVLVAFIVGALVAAYVPWVRRAFASRKEMRDEVNEKAAHVFFDNRIHHTKSATGLLIYLSLFEHIATIRADQRVLDSLGQDAIDELCANLIRGIQAGDSATALCDCIGDVGHRLTEILPAKDGKSNELANALILID